MSREPLENIRGVCENDSERGIGNGVRKYRQHGHDQNETGSASGMIGCKPISRFNLERQIGLEGKNRFVLGAVILKNPLETFESGKAPNVH